MWKLKFWNTNTVLKAVRFKIYDLVLSLNFTLFTSIANSRTIDSVSSSERILPLSVCTKVIKYILVTSFLLQRFIVSCCLLLEWVRFRGLWCLSLCLCHVSCSMLASKFGGGLFDLFRLCSVVVGCGLRLWERGTGVLHGKPGQRIDIGFHLCVLVGPGWLQTRRHLSRIKGLSSWCSMLKSICLKWFSVLLISQELADLLCQSHLL